MAYVAQQVKVPAGEWSGYDWQGKTIRHHRTEIRGAFGFRESTEGDQDKLAEWLAMELCSVELSRERLAAAVVARCRNDRMEPPAPGQVGRLVGRAVKTAALTRVTLAKNRSVGLYSGSRGCGCLKLASRSECARTAFTMNPRGNATRPL